MDTDSRTIEALNNKAAYLKKLIDYESAILIFQQLIQLFPAKAISYLNLADLYWDTNQGDKSVALYKTYISLMKMDDSQPYIPGYVYQRIDE